MDDVNEAIRQSAMIVTFHATSWTARAKDSVGAMAAASAAGADVGAYSAYKNLMYGADSRLKAVRAAQSGVRADHLRLTLPWGTSEAERGLRMLPTTSWPDYVKAIGRGKARFEAALTDFVDNYDADVHKAQSLLNLTSPPPGLYPRKDQLRSMFSMKADFQPIPAGSEFKGLPATVIQKLEQSYESRLSSRMGHALKASYRRAAEALEEFAERARNGNPRKASWQSIEALPSMIDEFNVVKDETASALSRQLSRDVVSQFSVDEIKDEERLKDIADACEAMSEELRSHL